ncbi:MAG: maleylpyruvate isomerase N-terminal domain-containing protein [Acidimicrobiales bacterium]
MTATTAATNEHRTCFAGAARSFVDLVRHVGSADWERPALGSWDVRGLVGHASRSFTALTQYLGTAASDAPVEVDGPVAYYLAALGDRQDHEARRRSDTAIAERGRDAGVALGRDPVSVVREVALDALHVVDSTPDDARVDAPVGIMTLAGYLPTRTFELTVHGLDLATALDLATPAILGPAIASCCELAGQLAAQRSDAPDLLLLLTGRPGAARGVSVL